MLLLIFAIVLALFWVRATRLTPEKYPAANPDDVIAYRMHLINNYRRYAGFFMLLVLLAIINGMLRSYGFTHHAHAFIVSSDILTAIIATIGIYVLLMTAKNAFRNHAHIKNWQ